MTKYLVHDWGTEDGTLPEAVFATPAEAEEYVLSRPAFDLRVEQVEG